jgi:tRNA-specific 2-thiouridylase
MLLPVGGFHKSQIRERAVEMGLKVADKKDSQEICFVTSGKHAEFVRNKSSLDTSGEIVTSDGKVVGHHPGIEGFTVGQRKGLGVAMGSPYYVTAVDRMTRRVVIGPPQELACRHLRAINGNWLWDFPLGEPTRSQVQVRYNSPPDEAWVTRDEQGGFEAEFLEDVFGISPGQLAAVFLGSRAMGCGWVI